MVEDFREISHSDGKVTFSITTDERGSKGFGIRWTHSRPVPAVLVGIYALPQGIPVATFKFGGLGQGWDPAPPVGCFPVFLSSDSEGKFGHNCHRCGGYWRSHAFPRACPYCANLPEAHHTLSDLQERYVRYYCDLLKDALHTVDNGDVVIDMDEVADAAERAVNRPAFYVSEEGQQHQFICDSCGTFNDVLGSYAYCSGCGTRNDLDKLADRIEKIRVSLSKQGEAESCLRDAVSTFDSFIAQYAKQLVNLVPMTKARKSRLERGRFYKIDEIRSIFEGWFDIQISKGVASSDLAFAAKMFLRRHVHEHNGGEADAAYLSESGDNNVREKQILRESAGEVHRLLGLLNRLGGNLHAGFHEIFPPLNEPIKDFLERTQRSTRV
ncbi:hypothetical protein [Methylobacterium sp. V23]|uniref:hypothetical protein n=1 Tax=Methylobacterium sp. V23 TaxID=2044878 RepID=UPI0011B0A59E|nr:hypothetical protein [Methylobacterium sp. V23]